MHRVERDLLGCLNISEEAYYGIHTARSAENFKITGLPVDSDIIKSLAMVKQAAALANMELGRLDSARGRAIFSAAGEIIAGKLSGQFIVDSIQGGAGTSINMNVNEVTANRAIEILGGKKGDYSMVSPHDHVNMSQSTNDVLPSAIRMALLKKSIKLCRKLKKLINTLDGKAIELDGVVKIGRTHLQDAVPIRLGREFGAYAAALRRCLKRLTLALGYLREVNLGATAVGTGINAGDEFATLCLAHLGKLSGYKLRLAGNMVDCTQNQDVLAVVSGSLKELAVVLSKVANDLRLMASGPRCGFGEIRLPAVQAGSSIMPGKVNPVIPEAVNQVCFQVMGNDLVVTLAVEAGQLELNVMVPVGVYSLINSISLLTNVLFVFEERCIRGISADAGRCRRLVENSTGLVTALGPYIGYQKASEVAGEALEKDVSVKDIILAQGLLSEDQLEEIMSPEKMAGPGRGLPEVINIKRGGKAIEC